MASGVEEEGELTSVSILQEYIPQYRVRFFEGLRSRLLGEGIQLRLFAGCPGQSLAQRQDSGQMDWVESLATISGSVRGRRFTLRNPLPALRGSDLVVCEQARRNLDLYPLLFAPKRMRPPVALWGHGADVSKSPTSLERALMSALTERADWFFAYTEGARGRAVERGVAASRTTVVQNSFDTSGIMKWRSELSDDTARLVLREMGIPVPSHDGRIPDVLVFLGSLVPEKGVVALLDTLRALTRVKDDVLAVFCGRGSAEGALSAAAEGGLPVTLVGRVGDREKAALSYFAKCLVIPRQVGMVAVDSFAMGVPIVTTLNGDHGPEFEYLEPGVNSAVVPTGDDFMGGVLKILEDSSYRQKLQRGCRDSAQRFTLEAMVDNFARGVREALEAR